MEQLAGHIADFIEYHQTYAFLAAGLIAFGESLVIIGFAIPATALMVILGGLIGAGAVQPIPIVTATIIGAILGDAVSYWIGRWAGRGLADRWPLARYKSGMARARLFFRRHGASSVFFGRFLGPVRSTVPLVAGMMAMDHRRFQLANIASAVVWSLVMLLPGWLAAIGAAELDSVGYMERGAAVLAFSLFLIFGAGAVTRKVPGANATRAKSTDHAIHHCCGGKHPACPGHI
ncbi:DedA family protein [Rhizobium multihospitium]|uniref:Membrane protein DedA, SNARE-associated domain n=1 Tax=Rhizobium multihospitium TaxID=410764 RepID=A0A1C3VYE3_9HYPH|nr:DedA family protein [Rhizobium multihospitium]SCB32584.1 membrane protein DedA, SNARE-associated domain [Rhizobium multihospitium]